MAVKPIKPITSTSTPTYTGVEISQFPGKERERVDGLVGILAVA